MLERNSYVYSNTPYLALQISRLFISENRLAV